MPEIARAIRNFDINSGASSISPGSPIYLKTKEELSEGLVKPFDYRKFRNLYIPSSRPVYVPTGQHGPFFFFFFLFQEEDNLGDNPNPENLNQEGGNQNGGDADDVD